MSRKNQPAEQLGLRSGVLLKPSIWTLEYLQIFNNTVKGVQVQMEEEAAQETRTRNGKQNQNQSQSIVIKIERVYQS
jgi:hypothetical protein